MAAPKADPARVVLVVDDEPIVLRMMERVLAEAGFCVQSASSGLRALELAGRWATPPDLLVTDLRMDGLNGSDLARLITHRHPVVRVLLVSAADPEHLEPGWPFLRKPFGHEELLHAVELLLTTGGRG